MTWMTRSSPSLFAGWLPEIEVESSGTLWPYSMARTDIFAVVNELRRSGESELTIAGQ
jgi:hypothetical protein